MHISRFQLASVLAASVVAPVSAQFGDIVNETEQVCMFQASTHEGYLQRTNDYDIVVPTTSRSNFWPSASFYVTPKNIGRLYVAGSNDRCGFDSQFQCLNTSKMIVDNTDNFYVGDNGSLYYDDSTTFWQCTDTAEANVDPPYIYPPGPSPSSPTIVNCSHTTFTASNCQLSSQFTIAPSSVASPAAGDMKNTMSSKNSASAYRYAAGITTSAVVLGVAMFFSVLL